MPKVSQSANADWRLWMVPENQFISWKENEVIRLMRSYEVEDYDSKVKSRGQTVRVFEGTVLLNCADFVSINGLERTGRRCTLERTGRPHSESFFACQDSIVPGFRQVFSSVHVKSNYTSLSFSLSGHLYNGLRCRCMQRVTRMSPPTSMLGFSQSVTTWPLALALLWTRRASRGILPCRNWETIRMTYCVHHSSFLVLASSPFNLKSPLESPLHVALSWSFRADWPTSHDMFCFVFSQGWKWYNKWDIGWQIYTECLICCLNDTHIIIHITW